MQRIGARAVHRDPPRSAQASHARAARLVRRQLAGIAHALEASAPERELLLHLGALHPVAMPGGEVAISHGEASGSGLGPASQKAPYRDAISW